MSLINSFMRAEGENLILEPKIGDLLTHAVEKAFDASQQLQRRIYLDWGGKLTPVDAHNLDGEKDAYIRSVVETVSPNFYNHDFWEKLDATENKFSKKSQKLTEALALEMSEIETKESMALFLCDLVTSRKPVVKINPAVLATVLEQKGWAIESKPLGITGTKADLADHILSEALSVMKEGLLLQSSWAESAKYTLSTMTDAISVFNSATPVALIKRQPFPQP